MKKDSKREKKKSINFLMLGGCSVLLVSLLAVLALLTPFVNKDDIKEESTEENFYVYKEDREEIIRMLVDGEIKKEPDRYGNKGFYFYYTPSEYIDAVKSETLRAAMHSKDKFFVFFQSAEQPDFNMVGLKEGFIYSSTGEFPTQKEFDYYDEYKKIDEHWYFVSDDPERFKKSCLNLCK